MVTKKAQQVIDRLLESNPDGISWDRAVEEVELICNVQQNTAEAYVRGVDGISIETRLVDSGTERMVVPDDTSGDTVLHNESEVIDLEVGQPTGMYFGELEILEDVNHPLVPRGHESGYIRRRMSEDTSALKRKSDVRVVTSTMSLDDFSTLLIGKHGVGKDKLVLHICAKTNRPVIRLVANDDPDFVDLLVGTYQPDEDGNFKRKKGLLSVAIENGYVFILDEFNALSGKVQTMLNMILESADQSTLVIPETNEVITPHEEFIFVGTQNPNEVGYSEREDVDQATGSRMVPVTIPPLSVEGEKKVAAANTFWDESDPTLDTLLRSDGGVISGLRALHDMGKTSLWVSTRDVIQIGQMAEKLGSPQAAAELVLVGRADPEDKSAVLDELNDHHW